MCVIGGCEKLAEKRGLCSAHYSRLRRHGDLNWSRESLNTNKDRIAKRFWKKVKKTDGCWEWTTAKNSKSGYGTFRINGFSSSAHRSSWIISFGPIPSGMDVCHRCDNRRCVRPDHLFLGTKLDNMKDMKSKGRSAKGERSGAAKLSEKIVEGMRRDHTNRSLYSMAKEHKVSQATVRSAVLGKTWRHVK